MTQLGRIDGFDTLRTASAMAFTIAQATSDLRFALIGKSYLGILRNLDELNGKRELVEEWHSMADYVVEESPREQLSIATLIDALT